MNVKSFNFWTKWTHELCYVCIIFNKALPEVIYYLIYSDEDSIIFLATWSST